MSWSWATQAQRVHEVANMSLADLLWFVLILCLVIFLIRTIPLPAARPPNGQSFEWVRAFLTCVVVIVAIIWLVEHGHGFFLRT